MFDNSSMLLPGTELPVARPAYVLRGHVGTIHALLFLKSNLQLLSGDSEGWIVIWSIPTKRPLAVWKAHDATILGAQTWQADRIITHGRDGKLRVWALNESSFPDFSTELPVEEATEPRKQPWIYHSVDVSSVTFCAFSACIKQSQAALELAGGHQDEATSNQTSSTTVQDILVAVPGRKDSEIEVLQLPSEKQVAAIPAPDQQAGKSGMVMALKILYNTEHQLLVIAGYESGRTVVFKQIVNAGQWQAIYNNRPHAQPILSIDTTPRLDMFLTSSADAIIAKHPLPSSIPAEDPLKVASTGHSGQQGLQVRSDGRIFATAGWDSRGRVYSVKTMKELAVLKWHKEGCYTVAFGMIQQQNQGERPSGTELIMTVPTQSNIIPVAESRILKAQSTHWLALGSKDGKISLWDIY